MMPARRTYRAHDADSARWDAFRPRPGDIVISTPSKCGTTWTQMLCALLIFDGSDLPAPLDQLSPWLDQTTRTVEDVIRTLEDQTHRRFIKTHTPLDGLPVDDRITYLGVGRDPRDAAVSMAHHIHNMDRERFRQLRAAAGVEPPPALDRSAPDLDDLGGWLRRWMDDRAPGTSGAENLRTILHHFTTLWEARHRPNVVLVHFGDLRADLPGELERLAGLLGLDITPARAAALAGEASLERMRGRAGELAPLASERAWKDTRRFFRSGGSGEWRSVMTAADRVRYRQVVAEATTPDLAIWAHHGRR